MHYAGSSKMKISSWIKAIGGVIVASAIGGCEHAKLYGPPPPEPPESQFNEDMLRKAVENPSDTIQSPSLDLSDPQINEYDSLKKDDKCCPEYGAYPVLQLEAPPINSDEKTDTNNPSDTSQPESSDHNPTNSGKDVPQDISENSDDSNQVIHEYKKGRKRKELIPAYGPVWKLEELK